LAVLLETNVYIQPLVTPTTADFSLIAVFPPSTEQITDDMHGALSQGADHLSC
jgi:hypothetical protein